MKEIEVSLSQEDWSILQGFSTKYNIEVSTLLEFSVIHFIIREECGAIPEYSTISSEGTIPKILNIGDRLYDEICYDAAQFGYTPEAFGAEVLRQYLLHKLTDPVHQGGLPLA